MQLRDIYAVKDPSIMVTTEDLQFLYDLLKHRDELSSISHSEMPTWERAHDQHR